MILDCLCESQKRYLSLSSSRIVIGSSICLPGQEWQDSFGHSLVDSLLSQLQSLYCFESSGLDRLEEPLILSRRLVGSSGHVKLHGSDNSACPFRRVSVFEKNWSIRGYRKGQALLSEPCSLTCPELPTRRRERDRKSTRLNS